MTKKKRLRSQRGREREREKERERDSCGGCVMDWEKKVLRDASTSKIC